MNNILSIDVEDWFHILELESTPDIGEWDGCESRVDENFRTLLDLLDETETKATCFFLGWIAERNRDIVKEAAGRGHEIASHGYSHRLIYTQSRKEFFDDVSRTKKLLEEITGTRVEGYRAPGFSIVKETPWAFGELARAGYLYDSSVFPAGRGHGGIPDADLFPQRIDTEHGPITEIPLSVVSILNRRMSFFGGGYLRLFPYWLIKKMTVSVNRENRPVVYYVHPREIDVRHPRLPMSLPRRFKSYVNLRTTRPKLARLLGDQKLLTFKEWLARFEDTI